MGAPPSTAWEPSRRSPRRPRTHRNRPSSPRTALLAAMTSACSGIDLGQKQRSAEARAKVYRAKVSGPTGPINVAKRDSERSGCRPLRLVSISCATQISCHGRGRGFEPAVPAIILKTWNSHASRGSETNLEHDLRISFIPNPPTKEALTIVLSHSGSALAASSIR